MISKILAAILKLMLPDQQSPSKFKISRPEAFAGAPLNTSLLPHSKGRRGLAKVLGLKELFYSKFKHSEFRGLHTLNPGPAFKDKTRNKALNRSVVVQRLSRKHDFSSVTVPVARLPSHFHGFKILFFSDLHLSRANSQNHIAAMEALVRMTREGTLPQADLVLVAGDFIGWDKAALNSTVMSLLRETASGADILAVPGDHDFHGEGGLAQLTLELSKYGVRILRNEQMFLEKGGQRLSIVGIDDLRFGQPRVPSFPADELALPRIALVHNLDTVTESFPDCFDLILSGHTHCGEINLGLIKGMDYLRLDQGYFSINGHYQGIRSLTPRATSIINPGFGSHARFRIGTKREGVMLVTMVGDPFDANA